MTDFKSATKGMEQMELDKKALRYLIVGADVVHSTAVKDPLGVLYIYTKPGMIDGLVGISNIDFVKATYAANGINLNKHVSKLNGQETEVLYVGRSELVNLNSVQVEFLNATAPLIDRETQARIVQIINMIHHGRNTNTNDVSR